MQRELFHVTSSYVALPAGLNKWQFRGKISWFQSIIINACQYILIGGNDEEIHYITCLLSNLLFPLWMCRERGSIYGA
jgi:hypothetical protein